MKYFYVIAVLIIIFSSSCTKTNQLNTYNLNIKVVSELTNQPVSNAKFYIRVVSPHNSPLINYDILIDSFSVTSNNNGDIACSIKYNNDPNISVKFDKPNDNYSTGLLPQKAQYSIADIKNTPLITFYVRKYAHLKINLKSVTPIDDNDAVGLSIFQDSTSYQNMIVDSVINYGVTNQPLGYPAANIGTNPYWVGKIVNSIIYGKIQEGTAYQIAWSVRRNGINITYKSPRIQTSINSLNSYDINY